MKTDKHLYTIFAANPQWIFELAGLESPGECELKAVSLKALDQAADAVVFPVDESEELTVVEFQFQEDATIYARIAIEMALLQQEHAMREVQGLIFFRYPSLDPQTEPWRRVIRAFQLRELLEKLAERDAGHPLAAVFQPVLLTNEETLEKHAAEYYNQIKTSQLTEKLKSTLLEVFVNWLEQRLKHRGKKEIEQMLIGELPDLRETQSGRDLIAIGKAEGKIEGEQEALTLVIEKKFGALAPEIRERVLQTKSVDKLQDLLTQVLAVDSVDELNW